MNSQYFLRSSDSLPYFHISECLTLINWTTKGLLFWQDKHKQERKQLVDNKKQLNQKKALQIELQLWSQHTTWTNCVENVILHTVSLTNNILQVRIIFIHRPWLFFASWQRCSSTRSTCHGAKKKVSTKTTAISIRSLRYRREGLELVVFVG